MNAKIAVLAGDGVGREIIPEAVKVLKAVAEQFHHTFEFLSGDVGGQLVNGRGGGGFEVDAEASHLVFVVAAVE